MLNKCGSVVFVICFIAFLPFGFMLPFNSCAVPADPTVHELKQQDGAVFRARRWGDEWSHGWETEAGHTIVFSEALKSWTYADKGPDGNLFSSNKLVARDAPQADLQKRIRPSGQGFLKSMPERAKAESREVTQPLRVVSPTGTGKIPVILITYSNTAQTYTPADFNTLLFGTGNYSMKDYYEEVSYNAFSISGSVSNWVTASNTHDYYGQNNAQGNDSWPGTLVREAVAAADAAFNFAPYDTDGDCYVDLVNIIHQGPGEESSSTTSTDIWSHQWSLNAAYYYGRSSGGEYTTNDPCASGGFIKINKYVIEPETSSGQLMTVGVFAHEYAHALGLPDLYDTDYSSEGIGKWSIMAAGSWAKVTRAGDRPSHMDAWSKYYLGWVTPTAVTGTLTNEAIEQAAVSPEVYKLLSGTPTSGEYFLVENRQKTGFDAGLPGAGLLIWHIDGSVISSRMDANTVNDNECHTSMSHSCVTNHYGVSLMQADNLWELENNINSGDSGDAYSSAANSSFTDTSAPNSKLYNGSSSNVSITNISASGSTITATMSAASSVSVCTYSISPTSQTFTSAAGTGSVTVTASASSCAWTATSSLSWVTITTGSGTGSGTAAFSVSANTTGATRTGNITVAGQTFTITQSAAASTCTYTILPASQSFSSAGGTGSVAVTASAGSCTWSATSAVSWATITSASGLGSSTVIFSVAANTTGAARTGYLTLAGQTFTLTQSATQAVSLVAANSSLQTYFDTIQAAYDATPARPDGLTVTLTEQLKGEN